MNLSILFQILQTLEHMVKPVKPCPRLCELQTLQFLPGNRQKQIKSLNAADKQCHIKFGLLEMFLGIFLGFPVLSSFFAICSILNLETAIFRNIFMEFA